MATAPALSVIMSVYNGARHLYAATQSILDQDFRDFEFLIVNDGSTDDSSTILRLGRSGKFARAVVLATVMSGVLLSSS